ncbi:hypothetical protein PVAND_015552 [Polypedilum vanderplanki]|uniref:MD-2-related lipid-recognition domain-containing protein n=1 Tax=Polypedilum vanderplanki TaxID=319348 RepID=A0A9J6BD63_POLVA|nr:hypothetical protein PVAND_015552 [Polypedilum vanderplanki]
MFKKVLISALSVLAILLTSVPSTDAFWSVCTNPSGVPGPESVTSPNCGATHCTVVRGEVMHADAVISSPHSHNELMVRGFVFLLGIGIPLPQIPPYDNGCNSLFTMDNVQTSCPTTPNTRYIWRVAQEVPQETPAFQNARVQFQIWDGNFIVGCVDLQATVI